MGRRIDVDQLVTSHDIADRLGIGWRVVHDWRRRYDNFPEPVIARHRVLVWHWGDVEAWARATGRL